MKNLKIKNLAVTSAFVLGTLITQTSSAQSLVTSFPTVFVGSDSGTTITADSSGNYAAFSNSFNISSANDYLLVYNFSGQSPNGGIYLYSNPTPGPGGVTLTGGLGIGLTSGQNTISVSASSLSSLAPGNVYLYVNGAMGTTAGSILQIVSFAADSGIVQVVVPSPELSPNAYALRSVYNIQSAALNAGLSYDCNVFDKQGICLSTGGRYSTTNSPETTTTSGLLIGSYRYDKNIRLGAWVDQNLSTNNTNGVKLGNSKPLFGVFGAWAERPDGLGYEVKVSAGYGDKDLIVARTVTNEGAANLNTTGIQTVSSYGVAIAKDWIASPYVGVKYLSIKRAAYVEGGQDGLVYDTLRQETTSALAGLSFKGRINPQTFTVLSAGVEHDLSHNVGEYSAKNSLFTVTSTAFNSKPQKTRPVVTAGVFYDIDKTQRLGLNAIHRQEAFQTTTSTTALATYTVGF